MKDVTKLWMARLALPALLTGALGAAVYWGNDYRVLAETYQRGLDSVYQKSFNELAGAMSEIENALSKAMVITSPQQYAELLGQACRSSEAASAVLGQLPGAYQDYAPLYKFLSEMGGYCQTLVKGAVDGTPVALEDRDQLIQLHAACSALNSQLRQHIQSGAASELSLRGEGGYFEETEGDISFKAEEGQELYPHLIYDGPFSESSLKAEPVGLPPEEVDENIALEAARAFMGELATGGMTPIGEQNGRIPAYGFNVPIENGSAEVFITKQGGKPLWMRADNPGKSAGKPDAAKGGELAQKGLEFLAARGYTSMISTYAQFYGGEALVNYAFVQDGAVVYNDLIKVWLDIETGVVTGFDASNYLFSHTQRTLPVDVMAPEEARERVSPELEIVQIRTALIPVTPATEALCYEFKGTYGGTSYIVYIDAQTGAERQVFLIIDSESGQLVV